MTRTQKLASVLALGLTWAIIMGGSLFSEQQTIKAKRLILKDGSYELIREYSIQGDRVHYYSAERREWEDMPHSLVNWDATKQFAEADSGKQSERANETLEKGAKERSEYEARFPLAAPALRLPDPDGVFLLDIYRESPELNELIQNGADLKKNLGRNILRGLINPIVSSKQTIELPGLHARVQSHTLTPSMFISIDRSDPSQLYTSETAKDHLQIVRCEIKNENRIVGNINVAVYGKVKQSIQAVEVKVEALSEHWAKITPAAALEPGEYVLMEFDEKGAMNQFVWDFGVDPAAPQNTNVVLPSFERNKPVLIRKPHNKIDD
jgi:hypothetical protein